MLNDLDTLRRAILIDPADDVARLAYADEIEDTAGTPNCWGKNVRWMLRHPKDSAVCLCAFSPGTVCACCDECPGAGEIPKRADKETSYVINRGFVSEIRLPMAVFTEELAMAMFSWHPITDVVLTDIEPEETWPDRWTWGVVGQGDTDDPATLSTFVALAVIDGPGGFERTVHGSREEALRVVNESCVKAGRRLVSLPDLEAAEVARA